MGNIENKNNFGVKLTNELMTDIIGAIIPGSLFIVCLAICVIIPFGYILNMCGIGLSLPEQSSFWWALLILVIILAYVFGLIFYRADIKLPDSLDIERQIVETLANNCDAEFNTLWEKFKEDCYALKQSMENNIDSTNKGSNDTLNFLKKSLGKVINKSQSEFEKSEFEKGDYLNILFPECSDTTESSNLALFEREEVLNYYTNLFKDSFKIFKRYEKHWYLTLTYWLIDNTKARYYFDKKKKVKEFWLKCNEIVWPDGITNNNTNEKDGQSDNKKNSNKSYKLRKALMKLGWTWFQVQGNLDFQKIPSSFQDTPDGKEQKRILLLLFYCILHTQCELGCCTKNRGEFPYMNAYKYFLKRSLTDCVKNIDWSTRTSRTKNQINKYKIEIQVFAPEAYALLNKNESHVRMSSASWHVAYRIRLIALWMNVFIGVFFMIKLIASYPICLYHFICSGVMIILLPLSIYFLSKLILRRIIKFIHYQRMRELYYTLHVYTDFADIIRIRKIKELYDYQK